jgi:hypothetical protein
MDHLTILPDGRVCRTYTDNRGRVATAWWQNSHTGMKPGTYILQNGHWVDIKTPQEITPPRFAPLRKETSRDHR